MKKSEKKEFMKKIFNHWAKELLKERTVSGDLIAQYIEKKLVGNSRAKIKCSKKNAIALLVQYSARLRRVPMNYHPPTAPWTEYAEMSFLFDCVEPWMDEEEKFEKKSILDSIVEKLIAYQETKPPKESHWKNSPLKDRRRLWALTERKKNFPFKTVFPENILDD